MKFQASISMRMEIEAPTLEAAEAKLDNSINDQILREHGVIVVGRSTDVNKAWDEVASAPVNYNR